MQHENEATDDGAQKDIDQFFALSIEMLCIAGFDGFFKRLNPAWSRTLGYSLEELMAEPFLSFIHPDDRASTEEICRFAASGGQVVSFRNRYRCRDGTYRLLEWTGNASPERQLFYTLARDITDRERTRERLAHLLQASRVVLYSCTADGSYRATFMTDNVADVLGFEPRRFIEDPGFLSSRIHPDDAARMAAEHVNPFEEERVSYEYRFLHSDGTYRWMHDEGKIVRDAQNNPVEFIGTWQDITERKRTEELLKRQAAALMELSTPLIPINDRVVVMPLIGTMDSQRVKQVLDTLLSGVAGRGADVAILDITGVAVVDTQVANALIRAAKAVRLLGAEVVLTGIRPDVARTLAALGVDLGDLVTLGSLQAGIRYAGDALGSGARRERSPAMR